MTRPASGTAFAGLPLRLRLAFARVNPFLLVSGVALVVASAGLWWVLRATWALERSDELLAARAKAQALAQAKGAAPAAPVQAPEPAPDNLARFYAALGPNTHAEQQVRTLFVLAEKNGLLLRQGEYKSGYDRNAHVRTYQVNLPVKGSYAAIWQFALGALQAIPFASLDDISFRRDAIGDANVEARLRLTLYLADSGGAVGEAQ